MNYTDFRVIMNVFPVLAVEEIEKEGNFDAPKILHLPLSELENRFNEIPQNENLVVVCRVGERSLRAANFLIHKGYDSNRVANMKFGLNRWVSKGYQTVGDPSFILEGDVGNSCCSTS